MRQRIGNYLLHQKVVPTLVGPPTPWATCGQCYLHLSSDASWL